MSAAEVSRDRSGDVERQPELPQLVRILLQRRWVIVAVTVASLIIGAIVSIVSPRIYKASTTVQIDQSAPDVLDNVREVVDLGASYWASKEYYETQYNVIRSQPVLQKAANGLGLVPGAVADELRSAGPGTLESRAAGTPLDGLSPALQRRLSLLQVDQFRTREKILEALETIDVLDLLRRTVTVEPVKGSHLVKIGSENTDPQLAALVANAVSDAYIDYNLDQKMQATRSAVDWLSDQMRELKQKLLDSENALYEFKRSNAIVSMSMEDRRTMSAETLSQLNHSLSENRARRLGLESRRDRIRELRQAGATLDSLEEIVGNGLVQQLKATELRLAQEEAELALKYTSDHPSLKAAHERVVLAQQQVRAEVENIVKGMDESYLAAVDTEHRLQAAIDEVKQESLEISKQEIEYNRLRRERDNSQALFELVLKREKEADLTQLLKVNNVRKLEAAEPPDLPIRPRVLVNLALAFLLGLLGGLGGAFAADHLDASLKNREDVEERIGAAFLGIIPAIRGDKGTRLTDSRARDLYVLGHPHSSVAECCRSVRTNLLFMSHERGAQRILVTSPGPQEGKTTSAISLAITMAQSGTRTVLIDTDMRRPRLHRSFSLPNETGISSLIVGGATLDEVVRATEVPNLDVITCGPIPPNPAELLHATSFKQLVQTLSERYERVFFDSPPVSAVADALVLGAHCDGVVLIVQARRTSWQAALDSYRRVRGVGGHVLGVVLNEVDLERPDNSYRYYYYYRSGYGAEPKASS